MIVRNLFPLERREDMAQSRKDNKGRVLRKGETQRSCDGKYVYTYTDPEGKRRSIYSKDIVTLREREAKLVKDQLDGLDIYTAGNATVNFVFDRYMSTKSELRATTRRNYTYMYDHFVRDGFGKKKIGAVKYSDVVQFYQHLIKEKEMQINSLETINTILHSTFQLAVRDNIIRTNPTDGAMAQVKKMPGRNHGVRHALTLEQQRAFIRYIESKPTYQHWETFFKFALGKGCRIIPLMDKLYDALKEEYAWQEENGFNQTEIDGRSGFIFSNRFGNVHNPQAANRAIKRIYEAYNAEEIIKAKREHREPVLIPHFSCHHLRHTFCTRMCESTTDIHTIQKIMGHANFQTTMDIYAEVTEIRKHEVMKDLAHKLDVF